MIEQLDRMIAGDAQAELPEALQAADGAKAEWATLKMAVEAIGHTAIADRVAQVRKQLQENTLEPVAKPAIVRSLFAKSLRIAAILLVVLGAATLYKYSSVSTDKIFNDNYSGYTLGTTRGNNIKNALEEAYKDKNWNQVVSLYGQETARTSKTYFLTGMAEMELRHYPEAIALFESVRAENERRKDNYFEDETEYYLSMSYLMNHETSKGVAILDQIRQNKNHLYYPLASRISGMDLKIIALKGKK